jgi:hypothetical protein
MMRTEKEIRNYAEHLAYRVRRRGDRILLLQRYGDHKQIGSYRTWSQVERAIEKFNTELLHKGSRANREFDAMMRAERQRERDGRAKQ